jgi:phospho-2-dehydro-3-deoxyheptonate aldolase
MIFAPERPDTPELHAAYPIDYATPLAIADRRTQVNTAIAHPDSRFLLAGPCALTDDAEILLGENRQWQAFASENGLVLVVRRHPWKPRSVKMWGEKMMQWHGLETGYCDNSGDPEDAAETAYGIMHHEATRHNNVSMELAFDEHLFRYGPLLSFAQIGARTRDQYFDNYDAYLRFLDFLAKREPTLPIGIKNDTDGSIDRACAEVDRINDARSMLGISAVSRAVLIFRGGENAKTPEAWGAGAIHAIKTTRGAVILDVAHGGEQAFDPNGKYGKSEEGQLACLEAALKLRKQGLPYVGVATESSTLDSPMDPAASPEAVRMILKNAGVLVAA